MEGCAEQTERFFERRALRRSLLPRATAIVRGTHEALKSHAREPGAVRCVDALENQLQPRNARRCGALQPWRAPSGAVVLLMPMEALKAIVKNGRLVLDTPTDLPEGLEVELAIVNDEDDSELLAELEASAEDEKAGRLVDMKDVIARLGTTT
jgi:hypothetical protein